MNLSRHFLILVAILVATAVFTRPLPAVVGPQLREEPVDTSPVPPPAKPPVPSSKSKYESVDRIKGLGKFKFGAKLTDFAPEELRIIDPKAKGVLLKISPYGPNYLVRDLTGLTWGNIPPAGLILTFHDGVLIDIQIALKASKIDFYLAERAFKEKYGPSKTRTFPVETWGGDHIQVTMLLSGTVITQATAIDAPAQGKVELFDAARWKKVESAQNAQLNETLDERYETASSKVKSNL